MFGAIFDDRVFLVGLHAPRSPATQLLPGPPGPPRPPGPAGAPSAAGALPQCAPGAARRGDVLPCQWLLSLRAEFSRSP